MSLHWPRVTAIRSWIRLTARIGIGVCVMALVYSCATVPGLREERPESFLRIPFVRVLLEESADHTTVTCDHRFAIECLTQGQQTVYYSSRPVVVKNRGLRLAVENTSGAAIQEFVEEVNIIPRGTDNRIRLDKKGYRGIMKILPYGQNVRLVNIVYMEDYLRGVVPPEIGQRNNDELEAIKAQSVAARTYAMAHLQQYEGEPFDMKSTVVDQLYHGADVEERLVSRAIDATIGQVIMYHDEMIDAYYHSTCGGMTDDIAHVWDKKARPYLKAVADGEACSWSKYFNWQEVFTEPQLRGRVEQYLSTDRGREIHIGPIRDIRITERTAGGRVARMVVHTEMDAYTFQKDRIRWVIGRSSNPDLILPSDRFDVIIDHEPNGAIKTITFTGRGWGHGVGMCQCGAIGLARAGWPADRIIGHYYSGVELRKLY
ncbi:MAG TPA: SpoIID/LytB domain-containing protein [Candidatus Deferrimicrobium sp.]|nr:SpoIID/LytB domain-containing protein [Candidatus Deferrimicrobium sp.]